MVFVVLSLVIPLLVLALTVSVVLGVMRKRRYVKTWLATGIGLLASLLLWADHADRPFVDDGPFSGERRAAPPTEAPDQTFPIPGGNLEVFDPGKGESAPTVLLRRQDGRVAWCIVAAAYRDTPVSAIRFTEYHERFAGWAIHGQVTWTFGTECTTWFLWPSSQLRGYWYSW